MTLKVFGYKSDGTLAYCFAKPENRGQGNCPHAEHIELSPEQLKSGFVRENNEAAVKAHFEALGMEAPEAFTKNSTKPKVKPERKLSFDPDILKRDAAAVAEKLQEDDLQAVKAFYARYESIVSHHGVGLGLGSAAVEELAAYLKSDEPEAVSLREYLGEDSSMENISGLLYCGVGAMTNAYEWSPSGRSSIARAFLSVLKNDMSKENYVASVLYFKGKCCYCSRILGLDSNSPPSGEHITPITPDRKDAVVGGTRFGNMALACRRCNSQRGSEPLESWVNGTRCIKPELKAEALGRIEAFRKFAGYEDYTPEKSQEIRSAIAEAQAMLEGYREENGRVPREKSKAIRSFIAKSVVNLSDGDVYPVEFYRYPGKGED